MVKCHTILFLTLLTAMTVIVAEQGFICTVYFDSDHTTYVQTPVKSTMAEPSHFFYAPVDAQLSLDTVYY